MADSEGTLPGARACVLVVDDCELFRQALAAVLKALGRTCRTAGSGEEALALLDAGLRPGIVLLDLDMPGLGGAATLPGLRARLPDLPVLICTGQISASARTLAREQAAGLLEKPFGHRELASRLEAFERPAR